MCMFVLFIVKADGGHLGMPYCKKSEWLYVGNILTQSWYNSIQISSFSHFTFSSKRSHLDWSIFV